jgi:hypothetical protein
MFTQWWNPLKKHFSEHMPIVKGHMTVIVPIYKKREQYRGMESTAKNYWVVIKIYKKTLAHKLKSGWKSLLKPQFWAQHSGNVQWPLLNQWKQNIMQTIQANSKSSAKKEVLADNVKV